MRIGGSAGVDMMHVARGRQDIYFEVGIYPWDVCAGAVIVEEAGGVCLDTLGGEFDLSSRRVMVALPITFDFAMLRTTSPLPYNAWSPNAQSPFCALALA